MAVETRVERYINVHANEAYKGSLYDRAIVLGYVVSDGIALRTAIGYNYHYGHEPEGIERENVLRGLNFLRRVHRDLRVYEDGVFSGVELDYHPGEIIEAFANLAYRNKRISKEQAIQQALLDMRHYVNRLKKAIEIGFWEKEPATAATQNENFRISSLLYLSYAQASVNATKDLLYKHTHTGLAGIQIRALEACPRSQLI